MNNVGFKKLSLYSIIVLFLALLASCSGLSSNKKANVSFYDEEWKYNFVSNYYYLECEITNDGDATADLVRIYYHYTDQYTLEVVEKNELIGSIEPGETITFVSQYIFASSIIKYAVDEVTWI